MLVADRLFYLFLGEVCGFREVRILEVRLEAEELRSREVSFSKFRPREDHPREVHPGEVSPRAVHPEEVRPREVWRSDSGVAPPPHDGFTLLAGAHTDAPECPKTADA